MQVLHFWYYLTGYVRIRVQGAALEKFINLCISRGIYLWDVRREGKAITGNIGAGSFFLLRPLARLSGSRIRIIKKRGLPFYVRRLRGRKMLVAGAVLFFGLLYVLGSFVWSIEVTGLADPRQRAEIMNKLEELGVEPGIYKARIDEEEIARQIYLEFPELAWVQVGMQGTHLVIDAVPKEMPSKVGLPAHLVARKDGLVQEVSVLLGEPQVSEGQTVRRGDILVKGVLGERPIAAQGFVWALVWYEAYGEWPRQEVERVRTGNVHQVVYLQWGENQFQLWGEREVPFQAYEEEVESKGIKPWRNLTFPVEAMIKTYHQVEEEVRELTGEEAETKARAVALAKIRGQLGPEARVLREEAKRIPTGNIDRVQVKVTVEVLENIAEARGFELESLDRERGQEVERNGGSEALSTDQ